MFSMMHRFFCVLLIVVVYDLKISTSHYQLKYYEILRPSDIGHKITKRGLHHSFHQFNVAKEVSFKALGRHFRLMLNPAKGLLSSHLKHLLLIKWRNDLWVDKDNFLEGRVFGETGTQVSAHIEDGILTAAIRTSDDTYIVEPSWRHMTYEDNSSMIVYRGSDVKYSWETMETGKKLTKFCTYVKEEGNVSIIEDDTATEEPEIRSKRQAIDPYNWEPVQTRCSLLLVADFRFYENMGGSNLKGTINFLISLIDRVNKIFLETEWKDSEKQSGFSGMGFVIQEVMVHTEPTPVSRGYVKNGYTLYLNSGLSTSRNHYGQRVITREADLVTAHGHNWGSEHDPDLPECSPDGRHGGSFLMYTYSVSGYDPNNKKFSPCSIRSVRAVLLAKASKCFSKPEESFCGNSLVEEGEECDAGFIGSEDNDPCCDSTCKLKPGAICSDKNAPCCRGCQLVHGGIICRESQPSACKREAYCNGASQDCPASMPQPDGSPCLDRLENGECVPFCETLGLHSCLCDREEDACKRCCRPTQNSTCKPIEPTEILRDGTPCIHGYCESGECKKTVQDIVERFWDIIEDININTVMKFLNDNIVGTVVIVSLVVWIPASCLISYVSTKPFRLPKEKGTRVIHIKRQNRFRPDTTPRNTQPSKECYRYYGDHNDRLFPRATYRPEPSPQHHYAHSDSEYYAPRHRHFPHVRSHGAEDAHTYRPKPPSVVTEAFTAL
ncbi:ADAM 17-like protease like protein [Argiope bruennichi]|uniref:ADAM 17-like protease like protein n=1 Tax=Argiope bruennichi TaxID=94029 RepID=A0A8T0F4B7_ARGBR|nr:ADAM 17-like protease like protein [Argiope bruennichi]